MGIRTTSRPLIRSARGALVAILLFAAALPSYAQTLGTEGMTSVGQQLYIVQNRRLHGVNPDTGAWTVLGGPSWLGTTAMVSNPAHRNELFIVQGGVLHRVSRFLGTWNVLAGVGTLENPRMAALGEYIFAINNNSFAPLASVLYRICPQTGEQSGALGLLTSWDGTEAMAAVGNDLYVVRNGNLYRVNPKNGSRSILGTADWSGTVAMAGVGDALYILQANSLHRVNVDTGAYTIPGSSNPVSTQGAWGGATHMTSIGDNLYIMQSGTLHHVDPATGVWTVRGVPGDWASPPGFIEIENNGGYEARFRVEYDDAAGNTVVTDEDGYTLFESLQVDIPAGATRVSVEAWAWDPFYNTFSGGWRPALSEDSSSSNAPSWIGFSIQHPGPPQQHLRVIGTFIDPDYELGEGFFQAAVAWISTAVQTAITAIENAVLDFYQNQIENKILEVEAFLTATASTIEPIACAAVSLSGSSLNDLAEFLEKSADGYLNNEAQSVIDAKNLAASIADELSAFLPTAPFGNGSTTFTHFSVGGGLDLGVQAGFSGTFPLSSTAPNGANAVLIAELGVAMYTSPPTRPSGGIEIGFWTSEPQGGTGVALSFGTSFPNPQAPGWEISLDITAHFDVDLSGFTWAGMSIGVSTSPITPGASPPVQASVGASYGVVVN